MYMQNLPHLRDFMTYETPDGDRAHLSFIEPHTVEDLRRRGRRSGPGPRSPAGSLGGPGLHERLHDVLGPAAFHWGKNDPALGRRAQDIYLHCRRNDVCLTHTFVNPMVDRLRPLADQDPYINAGIVERNSDGVIVRGARMVGTLAPFCDENLSFGAPG